MATQGQTFSDTVALFKARLAVNAPQMSPTDSSVIAAFAYPLLSADADTGFLITQSAPNMSVTTATGSALEALAANFGVTRNKGTMATATVVFKTSSGQPVQNAVTIPQGSLVTTVGDGITTIPVSFTTNALATIPAGSATSASNQVETVTVTGSPTGGTFTLTHSGQTTAGIAFNATASAVQSALQALSNVGTSSITGQPNVSCAGGPLPATPVTVTWKGSLGGLIFTVMSASGSFTGGTSPTVSSAITTACTGVTATATAPAAAGNTAAGTITNYATQTGTGGIVVSNATADGGTVGAGGADPDSDATLRVRTFAAQTSKYGTSAIQTAILAVAGVYDALVVDNGNGTVTYSWCDSNGAQLLATPSAVSTAVTNVLPVGVTASSSTFTVNTLTAIAYTYSAPAANQSAALQALIQTAIVNYINGTTVAGATYVTPQSGLVHNQIPTVFGMTAAVLSAVPQLTNFTLGSTTPAIGAASNTTIYRSSPVSSVTWTPTRV